MARVLPAFVLLALLFPCACSEQPAELEPASNAPLSSAAAWDVSCEGLVMVTFTSESCPICKRIEPALRKEVRPNFEARGGRSYTFDFTSSASSNEALGIAQELGMGEVFSQYAGRTGFVLLFRQSSPQSVTQISGERDPAVYLKHVQELAAKR